MSNDAGLRPQIVFPGQWRPHYPWEQIAWIRPPWTTRDSLWLDFPEAIFTAGDLLFLSHVNPRFPAAFADLPRVHWEDVEGGVAYRRVLPNGIAFGGSVRQTDERSVAIELSLENGSTEPLAEVRLQTCLFLRACKEFGDYTNTNKRVHTSDGWITLEDALEQEEQPGARYRVGWRGGNPVADLPWVVTLSNEGRRLVAMSWGERTFSIVGNPDHPCMHADPFFKDLAPGESESIQGRIVFLEGSLEAFEQSLKT
jgi:hypothetical protein